MPLFSRQVSVQNQAGTTSPSVFLVVGGFCFNLMDHGFHLLPHLPPLANASRQLAGSAGRLLDQVFAQVLALEVL